MSVQRGDGDVLVGMDPPPRATSKVPLPESSVIRKTAYGRSKLSIDDDTRYREMHCRSSVSQSCHRSSVFHSQAINKRTPDLWRAGGTDLWCWHCCHPFDGPPIPIPRSYDTRERCFVVFGNFCSLACAKGYMSDNPTFDSPQQVNLFTKMARDVYGTHDPPRAPPRVSLKQFGGPFGVEEFRKSEGKHCVILEPPFITSYMVAEESHITRHTSLHAIGSRGSVRGLRRPATPVVMPPPPASDVTNLADSAYAKFIKDKDQGDSSAAPPPRAAAAKKRATSKSSGTLSAFIV